MKPIVIKITKEAIASSTGRSIPFDKFVRGRISLAQLFQMKPIKFSLQKADELLRKYAVKMPIKLEGYHGWDDIAQELGESEIGQWDNTYNRAWWGPTTHFGVISLLGAEDEYGPALVFARLHMGGDVRGGYGGFETFELDSFSEEAPWYDWGLLSVLTTDRGKVVLRSADTEAVEFSVLACDDRLHSVLAEGDIVSTEELDRMFEWSSRIKERT